MAKFQQEGEHRFPADIRDPSGKTVRVFLNYDEAKKLADERGRWEKLTLSLKTEPDAVRFFNEVKSELEQKHE